MGWIRGVAWVALVLVVATPVGLADENGISGRGGARFAPQEGWLASAFSALRIRMEARLETGRLLEKQGRFDEALATFRSVDDLWSEGLREVKDLTRLQPDATASEAPRPAPAATAGTEVRGGDPVAIALRWLAAHQSPDGSWEAAGHDRWCDGRPNPDAKRPEGVGKPMYDPGVTGLALLAFLGAGHLDNEAAPHGAVVARGLKYLAAVQDPEGCFGPRTTQHYIYNHVVATLAMVEAYGLTSSPRWLVSARRGVDFLLLARNPYFAWRYGVKPGDNDTSVTGWAVMVLASAKAANAAALAQGKPEPFAVDPAALEGARAWIEKMTDPDFGRVGYIQKGSGSARPQELVDRFPTDRTEAMTAVGVHVRMLSGEDPRSSEVLRKGLNLIRVLPPVWNDADGSIDMYYWYFGTLATFRAGGEDWRTWNAALRAAALPSQRRDGDFCSYLGSWDAVDPWGVDGGRVYATALMTLCLEVSERYAQAFGTR